MHCEDFEAEPGKCGEPYSSAAKNLVSSVTTTAPILLTIVMFIIKFN